MKRTKLALVLILSLFSAMLGVQVVTVTKAAPPTSSGIGIISPANTTYTHGLLSPKVMMVSLVARNSGISMTYSLDGKSNVTIPLVIQGHDLSFQAAITGSVTLPELAEGSHSIVVYANDTAGNMGASETSFFTIIQETPSEPFPTTIIATASGASVAVVGVGLLVYFKKRKR